MQSKVLVKTMFAPIVFEISLLEGRSVLMPTQRVPGSERVKQSCLVWQKYEFVLEFHTAFSPVS